MSIWDWVDVGLASKKASLTKYKGSYNVTAGTALGAYFGGRHTHVFGADVRVVVDPEEQLFRALPTPKIPALLSGLTSNAAFVYGSSTSATYIGPKVDIRRAPTITRVSDQWVTRRGQGVNGRWTEGDQEDDPLDKASANAVRVLSVLALATAAALELAVYIKYRNSTDGSVGAGLMAVASYGIPSRLYAVIKGIEAGACYASWSEVSSIQCGELMLVSAMVSAIERAKEARRERARLAELRRLEALIQQASRDAEEEISGEDEASDVAEE